MDSWRRDKLQDRDGNYVYPTWHISILHFWLPMVSIKHKDRYIDK